MIFSRHFGFEFVLLLILCAASLFFFPVAHGSYPAVHGPVTVLQSIKTRLQMWVAMAIAAGSPALKQLLAVSSRRRFRGHTIGPVFSSPDEILVLRC